MSPSAFVTEAEGQPLPSTSSSRGSHWRAPLWLACKVTLTAGLLAWVLWRRVDAGTFRNLAAAIRIVPLVALLGLALLQRWLQAVQGALCLRGLGVATSTWQVARAQWVAAFCFYFMPGDLAAGVVSWKMLARDSNRGAAVAGGLIYLKLLGYVTLVPLALLGLSLDPGIAGLGVYPYVAAVGGAALLGLLPFCSARVRDGLRALGTRVLALIGNGPRLRSVHDRAWSVIEETRTIAPRRAAVLALLGFAANGLSAPGFALTASASGITLPWTAAVWMPGLLTLIHTLPVTLGGTGLREFGLSVVLGRLYGVSAEAALLVSLLVFLSGLLVSGGGGALVFLLGSRPLPLARQEPCLP